MSSSEVGTRGHRPAVRITIASLPTSMDSSRLSVTIVQMEVRSRSVQWGRPGRFKQAERNGLTFDQSADLFVPILEIGEGVDVRVVKLCRRSRRSLQQGRYLLAHRWKDFGGVDYERSRGRHEGIVF